MGLFAAKPGKSQGWLATLLCCAVDVDVDEHVIKDSSSRPMTRHDTNVCYEQPLPLRNLAPIRSTTLPVFRPVEIGDQYIRLQDRIRPVSEQPPSLTNLHFSESPLLGSTHSPAHFRQKSSPSQSRRPSIGRPTDFRRLELTEGQRNSLIPLKLDPVVLEPALSSRSLPSLRSAGLFPEDSVTPTRLITNNKSRETTQRHNRNSQIFLPATPQVTTPDKVASRFPSHEDFRQVRPPLSTQSSSSSIRSLRYQAADTFSSPLASQSSLDLTQSSASSIRSSRRHCGDSSTLSTPARAMPRLHRKRSSQSARKSTTESIEWDIDREILELNTIVEERRAEAARSGSPDDKHIPAVAPAMAGRARSETLNDIGSVFSRPLLAGSLPVPMNKRLSRPFTSMPELHAQIVTTNPVGRKSHELPNLSDKAPSSPSLDNPTRLIQDRIDLDRRRTGSYSSMLTAISDCNMPSLTAASTPVSRGHSRSVTADSKIAPGSPTSTVGMDTNTPGHACTTCGDKWQGSPAMYSPVGLAI